MPRNRSEKIPSLPWEEPEKALSWAHAVKAGERVGLVGPWFGGSSERTMNGRQRDANHQIHKAKMGFSVPDLRLLAYLPCDLPDSNARRIAQANLILRSMGHA